MNWLLFSSHEESPSPWARLALSPILALCCYSIYQTAWMAAAPESPTEVSRSRPVAVLKGAHGYFTDLVFRPDGRQLATSDQAAQVNVWTLPEGKLLHEWDWPSPAYLNCLVYSPDGSLLVGGAWNNLKAGSPGEVVFWNVTTGKTVRTLNRHSHSVERIVFSADGKLFATENSANPIRIWDTASGKEVCHLEGLSDEGYLTLMAFNPASTRLAVGRWPYDKYPIDIYNAATGRKLVSLTLFDDRPFHLRFSSDGKELTAQSYGALRTWDVQTGKMLSMKPGVRLPQGDFATKCISMDDSLVATCDGARIVKLWDVGTSKAILTIPPRLPKVGERRHPILALSRDKHYLASCTDDFGIEVWDVQALTK
jgi:WD40 repeat protein